MIVVDDYRNRRDALVLVLVLVLVWIGKINDEVRTSESKIPVATGCGCCRSSLDERPE